MEMGEIAYVIPLIFLTLFFFFFVDEADLLYYNIEDLKCVKSNRCQNRSQ